MAVTDWFECTVSVGGTTAKEYDEEDVEVVNENATSVTVTKYIEAKSGANFRIDLKVNPNYDFDCDLLAWDISLDGVIKSRPSIRKNAFIPHLGARSSQEGVRSGKGNAWTLSKFKFGNLEISDAPLRDHPSLSQEVIQGLGTITVKVTRQRLLEEDWERGLEEPKERGDPIPEKALKGRALTLSATLDGRAPCAPTNVIRSESIDENPVATFHFKYRSRKSLQDELIIPRSPTPLPLEERPVEELTPEEMRELLKRQREAASVKEENRKVKRERPESMQIQVPSRSYKVARNEDGIEVVNLADDENQETNTENPLPGGAPAASTPNLDGVVDLEEFELED